jgi:micrococcal nuclease
LLGTGDVPDEKVDHGLRRRHPAELIVLTPEFPTGPARRAGRAGRTDGVGRRLWRWIPVGFVAACANAAGGPAPSVASDPVNPANAVVELVVDGDTIDVTIDGDTERVRMIGIDTPETKKPDTPVECFGPEATAFTQSLLTHGTPVRLERDVVGRDDYGRILAYVYRASDSIFVNYEIIRHGYARPLTIAPNSAHAERFVEAARAAEHDDAGLWSGCRR